MCLSREMAILSALLAVSSLTKHSQKSVRKLAGFVRSECRDVRRCNATSHTFQGSRRFRLIKLAIVSHARAARPCYGVLRWEKVFYIALLAPQK